MELQNVKPLEIDKYLGKVKNRVSLVGVELEGGWVTLPPGVATLEHDGSVFNGRRTPGIAHIGELPIGPAIPAAIPELMRTHYPHKVNDTCGMHVHMSFDTLWHFQMLMVPEYQETMLAYIWKWAEEQKLKDTHYIWPRLKSESPFCRKEFWPDLQGSTNRKDHNRERVGHRYTHVHYCGRIQTIEIRTLPMLDKVKQSISAVQRVIDITNACLYVLSKQSNVRRAENIKIPLPNLGMTYEETIIEQV